MKLLKTEQKESGLLVQHDEKATRLYVCLALFAATLAVYWPVRHFALVNYDDFDYLGDNFLIQQGLTMKGLVWAFKEAHFANWHPLVWVSYMIECQFFGLRPSVHHLVNVGLHALNGVLLFLVLQTSTRAVWRSAFIASLFLFHPLRVESVAWVTERKDVLSGLFFMLTLLAYARYAQSKTRKAQGSTLNYAAALVFFTLGLLAKPMLVTIPFLLLLLDRWPWQREGEGGDKTGWIKLLAEKWPFFALAIIFSGITYLTQSHGGAVSEMTLGTRCQNAIMSFPAYLGKLFWPRHLAVLNFPPSAWPVSWILLAALFMIGLTALSIGQWRARPWLATGWFWFVGMLLPVSGLVSIGRHFIADRYTYLPCIGIFVAVTWFTADLVRQKMPRNGTMILGGLAVVVLLVLADLTRSQLFTWQNSETLWRQALRVNPNNYIAHNNLGIILLERNELKSAASEFDQAAKINPGFSEVWDNLGQLALREKDYGKAADLFQHAVSLNPRSVLSLVNLGAALRLARDYPDAENMLQKALALDADSVLAHATLAGLYDDIGKFDQAVPHYNAVLSYRPADAMSQCNLAIDLVAVGRLPEAMPHYEMALKLLPNNAAFHYYHGAAFLRSSHLPEGMAELRESLRLDPNYLAALNDLAWLLSTHPDQNVRNGKEAVQLAEQACQITGGKNARALCSLDAAYAEAGRFPEAIAAAEKARALFQAMGAAGFVNKTDARLLLYRANRPFHN